MAGRPCKSTDTLKLHGTYDKSRHGKRAEPAAPGVPVKPDGLEPEASAHWDEVVPKLVANRTAREQDSPALRAMCEAWGLYRACYKLAVADPTDKAIRCAVLGYKHAWETLACRFGLNPSDRTRLIVKEEKKAPDGKRPLIIG